MAQAQLALETRWSRAGQQEKGHAVGTCKARLCTSPAEERFRSQIKAQRSEVEVLLAGCREWASGPEGASSLVLARTGSCE